MTTPDAAGADVGFELAIPDRSPTGAPVTIERGERDGSRRLHASTADGSEVYVEVTVSPGLVAHEPVARAQVTELRERAADARIEGPVSATVAGRPATILDFEGTLGGIRRIRRFAYLDAGGRTYRIVHDPSSPANAAILAGLVLDARR